MNKKDRSILERLIKNGEKRLELVKSKSEAKRISLEIACIKRCLTGKVKKRKVYHPVTLRSMEQLRLSSFEVRELHIFPPSFRGNKKKAKRALQGKRLFEEK